MAIVRNDVKRIDRLITDISDASRLDAELSRESSDPVDIRHLLETIVEVYNFTDLSHRVPMHHAAISICRRALTVLGRDEQLGPGHPQPDRQRGVVQSPQWQADQDLPCDAEDRIAAGS